MKDLFRHAKDAGPLGSSGNRDHPESAAWPGGNRAGTGRWPIGGTVSRIASKRRSRRDVIAPASDAIRRRITQETVDEMAALRRQGPLPFPNQQVPPCLLSKDHPSDNCDSLERFSVAIPPFLGPVLPLSGAGGRRSLFPIYHAPAV